MRSIVEYAELEAVDAAKEASRVLIAEHVVVMHEGEERALRLYSDSYQVNDIVYEMGNNPRAYDLAIYDLIKILLDNIGRA